MPAEQIRALVAVAVAAEHQVDPVGLQDRQGLLAHLHQLPVQPVAVVGVVAAFGVGRVVPEGDQPGLVGGGQVRLQPRPHRRAPRARRDHGVQGHEVDVAVVERIVELGARGQATGLAPGGHAEALQVGGAIDRAAEVRLVVADGRPEENLPEHLRVKVEHRALELLVGPDQVGVVPQHQPDVGVPEPGELPVGPVHGGGVRVSGARVADDPDARRLGAAGQRRRDEEVLAVASPQQAGRGPDGVIETRGRGQAGEPHLVLGGGRAAVPIGDPHRPARAHGAVRHPAARRQVGAPADGGLGGGADLKVGAAGDRHRRVGDHRQVEAQLGAGGIRLVDLRRHHVAPGAQQRAERRRLEHPLDHRRRPGRQAENRARQRSGRQVLAVDLDSVEVHRSAVVVLQTHHQPLDGGDIGQAELAAEVGGWMFVGRIGSEAHHRRLAAESEAKWGWSRFPAPVVVIAGHPARAGITAVVEVTPARARPQQRLAAGNHLQAGRLDRGARRPTGPDQQHEHENSDGGGAPGCRDHRPHPTRYGALPCALQRKNRPFRTLSGYASHGIIDGQTVVARDPGEEARMQAPSGFRPQDIRNIALLGHAGSGKTTLSEAMLHRCGMITRLGVVENANTVSDFEPEARAHGHSTSSTLLFATHEGRELNFIDTPGAPDFIGHALAALPAVETAVVVINAADRHRVQHPASVRRRRRAGAGAHDRRQQDRPQPGRAASRWSTT